MRLNKQTKNDVINAIIRKNIQPKIENVKEEIAALTQELADQYYSKEVQKWIDAAPEGGVSIRSWFGLKIAERKSFKHELLDSGSTYSRGNDYVCSIKRPLKVIAVDTGISRLLVEKENHKKRIEAITQKLDAIKIKKETSLATLKAALWACNTHKQLQDNYPDLATYLPKAEKQTKALTVTNDDVADLLKQLAA